MVHRIGVILVHGIGEQKRFEHLDSEVRGIIAGLRRRKKAVLTVEILGGDAAAYQADQDTWASGRQPSARITVREPGGTTEINVHEVWWADVNEPYSLAKQLRFWLWGLAVWTFPASRHRDDLPGYQSMFTPAAPSCTRQMFVRFELFLAGLFFLVAAFSVGAVAFLAKRLLGLEAPEIVRVFVNYISGVKLYNQSHRFAGKLWPTPHGFLDTLEDPPRVSIRRRMIATIAKVAFRTEPYDRWYILGHSLGSVVAFNGTMENGQAFANYLDRETWDELVKANWAGKARSGDWVKIPPGPMSPSRPVWLADDDVVYRDKIFERFAGLLTYGSPIGKFATIWPARVPVNRVEAVFNPACKWINIFDLRDPVSGPLRAFEPAQLAKGGVTSSHCPPMLSIGYAAHPVLLLSHIRYLAVGRRAEREAPDVIADWLLTGTFGRPVLGKGRWYSAKSSTAKVRLAVSWLQWIVAFLFLAAVGTVTARGLWHLALESSHKLGSSLSAFWSMLAP